MDGDEDGGSSGSPTPRWWGGAKPLPGWNPLQSLVFFSPVVARWSQVVGLSLDGSHVAFRHWLG